MKAIKHVVVAAALTCGLVSVASAHVFVGFSAGGGFPAPAMVVSAPVYAAPAYYPPAPVYPAPVYPAPVYAAPVYAAPAYVPRVSVGYVASPGWYGAYHPWHYRFGYWH